MYSSLQPVTLTQSCALVLPLLSCMQRQVRNRPEKEKCTQCGRLIEKGAALTQHKKSCGVNDTSEGTGARKRKRNSYSAKFKLEVVEFHDELKIGQTATNARKFLGGDAAIHINPVSDTADYFGVPVSNVSTWINKERDKIVEAASKTSTRDKKKQYEPASKSRFPDVDKLVIEEFKKLRAQKKGIGKRWLIRTYRKYLQQLHPMEAPMFRGSNGWRIRFYKRHNWSLRKRTNKKKYTPKEAERALQRYCGGIQLLCQRKFKAGFDDHYSAFPRPLRNNLDQVGCSAKRCLCVLYCMPCLCRQC
jgi:hypothetical protein